MRRLVCVLLLAAFATPLLAAQRDASDYPMRPIRLVVGQSAGGNADLVARTYAHFLGERLGQQVVVDNRPGAGGLIATELVTRAAPDGHTLLLAPTSHAVNPSLMKKLPYDTRKDVTPISLLSSGPNMLLVSPGNPARTVQEVIDAARAHPGKINFSSAGVGSANHLAAELFKLYAGIDIVHVPYKGGAAAMVAVASGETTLSFGSMGAALGLVRAGKLRPLALTARKRWPVIPEVPTMDESGLKGFESGSWQALLGPAKLPEAITNRLSREVMDIARSTELQRRLMAEGLQPLGTTPEALDAHIAAEIEKWAKVIKAAGLSPQ
jgi:tripartite-type tricarboxylate transporter receptor subunit TctC